MSELLCAFLVFSLSPTFEYKPNWLPRFLRFYVLFSTFRDTIELFDSDGLVCRNSLQVFS